jgi:hypothetical protein
MLYEDEVYEADVWPPAVQPGALDDEKVNVETGAPGGLGGVGGGMGGAGGDGGDGTGAGGGDGGGGDACTMVPQIVKPVQVAEPSEYHEKVAWEAIAMPEGPEVPE